MKRIISILLTLLLCGCAAVPSFTQEVVLYYPAPAGADSYTQLITQVAVEGAGKTEEDLLEAYFSRKDDPSIVPFPDGVAISSLKQKEDQVTLVLTDAFASLSGIELTRACICIFKTLSQLTDVSTVTIGCQSALIDGEQSFTFTTDSVLWLDEGKTPLPTEDPTTPTK